MIVNPPSAPTLEAEWQGVIRMRERIRHLVISTFISNKEESPAFGDIFYNLPLLLAFDVLEHTLLQWRGDEQFAGSGYQLSELLDSAKTSLPWIDWECLREAANRQNEIASSGKLFGDVQCLQDIGNIEAQLAAWRLIDAA